MRIGVITDVHANLPALEVALAHLDRLGIDALVHTGDVIAIGPYPAECLDTLLSRPDITLIKGNHDAYFADGLPPERPEWMYPTEWDHQQWTHAQLDDALRPVVAAWPWAVDWPIGDLGIRFIHYARDAAGFAPIIGDPSPTDLDRLFASETDLLFYGHHHPTSDLTGRARYINPGALGATTRPEARFAVLEIADSGAWDVALHALPYDRDRLVRAFAERDVAGGESILRMFFGIG
jgi:predicted phosphodiesterase